MDAILVIDVPERVSPEEEAQLLNTPGESYFLVAVLPVGGGYRAFFRRYKQPPKKAEGDATAMSVLRANRDESVRTIVDVLAKAGIKRGRQWVCEQLDATCAEDGREQEALALVKEWAVPVFSNDGKDLSFTAKDVVDELRRFHKIKRSLAWAREKLEAAKAAAVSAC